MKKLFLLLFTLPFGAHAQDGFPEFPPDSITPLVRSSPVFEHFSGTDATVISYTTTGYWSEKRTYYMIVRLNDEWKAYRWRAKLLERGSSHITRITRKRIHLTSDSVDQLLAEWTALGFWSLDQDSINIRSKQMEDGHVVLMSLTDGHSDVFEIMQKGKYRELSGYMPEHFQKEIPVIHRQTFIQGKHAFERLILPD
jgi:hypothetical protein